jgi:hypothetical protein
MKIYCEPKIDKSSLFSHFFIFIPLLSVDSCLLFSHLWNSYLSECTDHVLSLRKSVAFHPSLSTEFRRTLGRSRRLHRRLPCNEAMGTPGFRIRWPLG